MKKEENYIKKREKGLKNASFSIMNSKMFVTIFAGKKFNGRGVGGIIKMHNIYPCPNV